MIAFLPKTGSQSGRVGGVYIKSYPQLPIAADRSILVPEAKSNVPELDLSARAALVKDAESGVIIYEKHSAEILPIASLTKLMTAIVVWKNLAPEALVPIQDEDVAVPLPHANLALGEEYRARDLLKAMLISSANDAAMALGRATFGSMSEFVIEMNREAWRLGMWSTSFTNPVGFDDPQHYSDADDLAKLVNEFLAYPDLVKIVAVREDVILPASSRKTHRLVSTNKLLGSYQNVVGLKTGFTTESLGNLIILVDPHLAHRGKYYSIILGSPDREAESIKLLDWVKDYFIWK